MTYLPSKNLKASLTYPNDAVVTWTYEPHRNLLTAVTNATYSTYVYTNDLLGRRTSKNNEQYGYNVRDELTSANDVSYAYDDIGNRTTAEGKTYTANNLNQYTAIDDFTPQYDADGNQTLIKTETGIWSVTYNAENRPIRWQSGDTVITMAFDRMGRRIEMRTLKDGSDLLQRFVYDNYLCIQQLRGVENALFHSYVWDPTEPIATRPLIFIPSVGEIAYYFHDGNKNVSDLVGIQGNIVHYAYTPFGSPTVSAPLENPFGFSSECYDKVLALFYYNYRHYNPSVGRWNVREPLGELGCINLFHFSKNNPNNAFDVIGRVVPPRLPIVAPPVTLIPPDCSTLKKLFDDWYDKNKDIAWTKELTPCPSEMEKEEKDGKIVDCHNPNPDVWEESGWIFSFTQWWGKYHPGGKYELRTKSTQQHGNQCIYDACCKLMTQIPAAGTADYSSPNGTQGSHQKDDVQPFEWARKLDVCYPNTTPSYVERYYERRPSVHD